MGGASPPAPPGYATGLRHHAKRKREPRAIELALYTRAKKRKKMTV